MSADLSAEVQINLDTAKFDKGVDKIEKGLDDIERKADSTGTDASSSIEDIGDEAKKTGDKVKASADKGGQGLKEMGDEAEDTSRDMTAVGVSVLGLGQAIGGLSDAIFSFKEKLVKLDKSAFGVAETTRDMQRAAEDLETAMKSGAIQGRELTRLIEDLDFLYTKLEIEQREVVAEQDALNSEFVNFGLIVGQTVAFSVITLNTVLSKTQKEFLKTKGAMLSTRISAIAMSNTFKTMIFDIGKFRIALGKASLSLKGLGIGVKGFLTALGPLGIAMIGIGVAFEIWNSNAFGIQEAMTDLWNTIKQFIPHLALLETLVTNIFPDAYAQTTEFDNSIQLATYSTQELILMLEHGKITAEQFAEAVDTGAQTMTDGLDNVDTAATNAADGLNTFSSSATSLGAAAGSTSRALYEMHLSVRSNTLQQLEQRAFELTGGLQYMAKQGIDPLSPAWKLARKKIEPEILALGQELKDVFGQERFEEFQDNINKFGLGFEDAFDKINSSVDKSGKKLDEFKKKQENYNKDSEATYNRTLLGHRGNRIIVSGFDAAGNPIHKEFRSKIFSKRILPKGGAADKAVFKATKYAKSITNKNFSDITRDINSSRAPSSRKRQQREVRRQKMEIQKRDARQLNKLFGNNLFAVKTQSANRFNTILAPTAEGARLLTSLGLGRDAHAIIAEGRTNPTEFYGLLASIPVYGTKTRTRIKHNNKRVSYKSTEVVGSRSIVGGAKNEGYLVALSMAVKRAKEKITKRAASIVLNLFALCVFTANKLLPNNLFNCLASRF